MYIHLTQEEINYLLEAIKAWETAALQYMQTLISTDWSGDEDCGHNPFTPRGCYNLQEAQIEQVQCSTQRFINNWENNQGNVCYYFLNTKIWPFSIHADMESPILLGIEQKRRKAYAAIAEQKTSQRFFGTSSNISAQQPEKIETFRNTEDNMTLSHNAP